MWSFSSAAMASSSEPGVLRVLGQFLGGHLVDVAVERLARVGAVLDAVERGHHDRGEGQVRVAARVGAAELDALGLRVRRSTSGCGTRRSGCARTCTG